VIIPSPLMEYLPALTSAEKKPNTLLHCGISTTPMTAWGHFLP